MANDVVGKVITSVVTETMSQGWKEINGRFSLSNEMERNQETLKEAVARLRAIRDDCEMAVQRKRMKTPTNRYNVWLSRVIKIVEEVETLEARYEQDSKLSSKRNVMCRSSCSNKMAKTREEVLKLVEEGNFTGGFLVDKPPDPVLKVNAPDIGRFPTLQKSLEKTLDLLRNHRVKGIGLHGPVGAGKTSIMQNLNNHEEVAKMFDMVIWVKVSTERSEEKLQEDIARRLRLSMDGITHPDEVARSIYEELKDKKYLLLLDKVVDSLDLSEMGIPDNNNGSKVVLTTEFRHVCNSMADRLIEVRLLTPNEAWMMFQDIVIDIISLPGIKPVAQLVAKECSRLPLLIKTVAASFKSKDSYSEWKIGLEELRKWPEFEIEGLTQLHASLKFCYDQLKDEEKKKCFLYGALYPADSKIYTDYLLESLAAEGFLGKIDEKRRLQDARDKGFAILKHLTNVSLLEKGERMMYVQMSNSIRQFALNISSQDPNCKFLVERGEQTADDWQQAKRISMIDTKLRDLPENPNCSMLLSLLLQRNPDLVTIPPSFFENTSSLLVLDFFGTGIVSLPSSLLKLTGLKGLYLNECVHLTEFPPQVGELHQLEVLDIRGCKITFIPIHIRNLVYLRCLRLSYYKRSEVNCSQDMEIDRDVISKLSRLEELIINIDVKSYNQWCNEVADVIRQVATLKNLSTLRVCFPESQILRSFMENSPSWKDHQQLISFRFFIGCRTQKHPRILDFFQYKISRYLRYCYGENENDSAVCGVLAETEAFELIGHKDIMRLSDFAGTASLNQVRGCLIEHCHNIRTIVDGNMTCGRDILPNLEQLHLYNLISIKSIFDGSMSCRSLSRLQTIVVIECPMLTKLFSNGMIQQLSELQYLAIADCSGIEELIMEAEVRGLECALPKLETLGLQHLPKLTTICKLKSLKWPSLKLVEIFGCYNLKELPFSRDNAPSLRSIKGEKVWWDKLQWQDIEVRDQLPFAASAFS